MTKIFGQEVEAIKNQLLAIVLNLYSWALSLVPFGLGRHSRAVVTDVKRCVSIGGPGGLDVLQVQPIPPVSSTLRATVGYNLPGIKSPYFSTNGSVDSLPRDYVLINNAYFSVNYADICIRWG